MKKNKNRVKVRVFKDLNKPILILTLIYAVMGAFFILDASHISSVLVYGNGTPYYYFTRQLAVVGGSLLVSLAVINIPTNKYLLSSTLLSSSFIVIMLVLLIRNSINTSVNEVTLSIAGGSFQVAEPMKVFLIMFMSSFLSIWTNKKNHRWWTMLIPIGLCILSAAIIYFGGDFGSAAIMAVLYVLVFLSLPSTEKYIRIMKLVACICLIGGVLFLKFGYLIIPEEKMLNDYRWSRFNYKNPCDRYEDVSGYQVCNGYIAIDNGGVKGTGIGNSVQKYMYLPASHTDFIFPIVVEEFGIIIAVLVIIGYMVIIALVFNVAKKSKNLQNSMIAYGIGIYFMLHIFVNLGGVLGVIPLTGVPLPFLSYGGTFCLTIICSFAVVQRIHIENMAEKRNRLLEGEEE
ncbi:MAG: FtsW/RodA/SpoVE family cell cycle protein [Bacilli bacterium]|nr:FtsW/RodA/SpoVE family cell cycle protein [Bacilli bacterium]